MDLKHRVKQILSFLNCELKKKINVVVSFKTKTKQNNKKK